MQFVMTGGTQGGYAVTHGYKNLEEDHSKVTSRDDQEVRGSVPNNPVEKTRHALSARMTVAFRRVYDNEEG